MIIDIEPPVLDLGFDLTEPLVVFNPTEDRTEPLVPDLVVDPTKDRTEQPIQDLRVDPTEPPVPDLGFDRTEDRTKPRVPDLGFDTTEDRMEPPAPDLGFDPTEPLFVYNLTEDRTEQPITDLGTVDPTKPPVPDLGFDPTVKMVSDSFYIPKTRSSKPLGEDSHFICTEPQAIGIADGVGSWSKKGVDAGEYARELMKKCHLAILSQHQCGQQPINPKRILTEAYSKTKSNGSSTACIITLDRDQLHAVNVGDSGFVLVRGGKVVYKSPVQQHRFNHPYQLGRDFGDSPSSGFEMTVSVKAGDVTVAATDGLFDNVTEGEIEMLVKKGLGEGDRPGSLARVIVDFAMCKSLDCKSLDCKGGKKDDITMVVGYIVPSAHDTTVD